MPNPRSYPRALNSRKSSSLTAARHHSRIVVHFCDFTSVIIFLEPETNRPPSIFHDANWRWHNTVRQIFFAVND